MRTRLIILVLFLLITFSTEIKATSPAVRIIPSRFELLVEPRHTSIEEIMVSNSGQAPLTMQISIQDWTLHQNGTIRLLPADTTNRSAVQWVRFNPRNFTIKSGETQVVRFAVKLPPQVEPGEYRTAIVLLTEDKYQLNNSTYYRPTYAVMVYINVPDVNRDWGITVNPISRSKSGKYQCKGKLQAEGNAHLRVSGEYYLFNQANDVIEQNHIGKWVVLPGEIGEFDFSLQEELEPGRYQFKMVWKSIPAFYQSGRMDEYPVEDRVVVVEKEIDVKQ